MLSKEASDLKKSQYYVIIVSIITPVIVNIISLYLARTCLVINAGKCVCVCGVGGEL